MKDAMGENKEKVNPKEWTIKEEKIKSIQKKKMTSRKSVDIRRKQDKWFSVNIIR